MTQENRFTTIVKDCLLIESVPELVLKGLDGICQMYDFDRTQNLIRIDKTNQFRILMNCKKSHEPHLITDNISINLEKSYYRRAEQIGCDLLNEIHQNEIIHIKNNDDYVSKYKDDLSFIGYDVTDKNISEMFLIGVSNKNIGLLGITVLEKLEGSTPLNQKEVEDIRFINNILNEKIYNFETTKQLREEEHHHAYDELTKLPLLPVFKKKAKKLLTNGEHYCLFVLDIDKFKYINDIWSFETGNDILFGIATIIKNIAGDDGLACRISDDRFILMCKYYDEHKLTELMMKIDGTIVQMQHEYFNDIKITVIAGVYVIDSTQLIHVAIDKANIARRSIKGSYKNNFQIYNDKLENLSEREKQLEKRMNPALENKEFVSFLQPKFDINTHELCGAEALVRWHAHDRVMSPIEFIPSFEKNGFIMRLDFEIYEQIFEFIQQSIQKGYNLPTISLNVSRGHINNPDFIAEFVSKMDRYSIPHELIELEITESIFMEDKMLLQNFIKEIRQNKMTVSIDDFGTAYSSLNLLKDIVVDVVKMDKYFIDEIIQGCENVKSNKVIIKHIVAMISELNFEIIFEGIESEEQIAFLKEIGVKFGQGFFFARPMPLAEFENQFFKK